LKYLGQHTVAHGIDCLSALIPFISVGQLKEYNNNINSDKKNSNNFLSRSMVVISEQ